jgi:hypothetical protein
LPFDIEFHVVPIHVVDLIIGGHAHPKVGLRSEYLLCFFVYVLSRRVSRLTLQKLCECSLVFAVREELKRNIATVWWWIEPLPMEMSLKFNQNGGIF